MKHLKRLIIQPELVQQLSNYLPPTNTNTNASYTPVAIYLSSDCEDVAIHMKNTFLEHGSHSFRLVTDFNEYVEKLVPTGMFTIPISDSGNETENVSDTTTTSGVIDTTISTTTTTATANNDHLLKDGWLSFNPLGVPSERELLCEVDWRRVWRCIFIRI